MTNQTITLSSDNTKTIKMFNTYILDDVVNIIINFENIDESAIPMYLKIDWGDGTIESFDNNIIRDGILHINNFNHNPIFTENYNHQYYPSDNSLYKCLSAQVLIKYFNSDESWFIIPIKIRTYDYFESIYDLTLVNCNILPTENNDKQYQFITEKNNYLLELRGG